MEAAVRAFEDWEFRVLEQESGIDEDESTAEEKEEGSEVDKEVSCQHHMVNTAQVNNVFTTSLRSWHWSDVFCRSARHLSHVGINLHTNLPFTQIYDRRPVQRARGKQHE